MAQTNPVRSANGLAWLLGLLALIPFAAGVYCAYAGVLVSPARALTGLLAYAATIVSFIGGIQWGRQLEQAQTVAVDMALAVCPALIAWLALLLEPPWPFALLLFALVFAWLVDEHGLRRGWQTPGFVYLRRLLTAAVGLCLLALGWRVMRG